MKNNNPLAGAITILCTALSTDEVPIAILRGTFGTTVNGTVLNVDGAVKDLIRFGVLIECVNDKVDMFNKMKRDMTDWMIVNPEAIDILDIFVRQTPDTLYKFQYHPEFYDIKNCVRRFYHFCKSNRIEMFLNQHDLTNLNSVLCYYEINMW